MGMLTPIATALAIIVIVAGTGAFVAYFRDRRKYRGYEGLMSDAAVIKRQLDGEIFRDGDDLVISGNVNGMPTYVRFSHAETTPGVHIRMEVPANLRLAIAARSAPATEGRASVRTGDETFDTRYIVRCDEPIQAKLFVSEKAVLSELQKLCCSARTYFTVVTGAMELSELTIPSGDVGWHVAEHVASMRRLIPEVAKLPGSDKIKIKPLEKDRHVVAKAAIAVGIVAAILAVFAATKPSTGPTVGSTELPPIPEGVPMEDAQQMVDIRNWRIASELDFDGDAAGWLKSRRKEATGRISGHFGSPEVEDRAYVLANAEGERRLVIFVDGQNRYDSKYPYIGLIARVPKANVGKINWAGSPPDAPDGDGVLVVRKRNDRSSGVIFFSSGGRIVPAVPVDYQTVDLLE